MSVRTGEDLRLMIRRFGRTAMLTAIMAAGLWISSGTAFAAEPEKPAPPANTAPVMLQPERLPERLAPASPSVQPAEMDKALEQTLKKSRYAWRIPREQRIQEGKVLSFIRLCAVYVRETVEKVAKVIGKIFDFLFGRSDRNGATPKVADSAGTLRLLLIVASVLVVCVLLLLIYRKMAGEPPITDVEAVHISPARPDLNDENTSPDALSDDGWMALAQQLAEEGELRLALRALFLAGLAILAGRRMILVAKHKSNLDYLRELRSRNHETPTLPDLFKVNTLSFESVWYGDHPGSTEMLERMRENVERLRDHV
jgi:hypothetical protein